MYDQIVFCASCNFFRVSGLFLRSRIAPFLSVAHVSWHRGVTRLDGARGKKQIRRLHGRTGAPMVEVWRPHEQIWVLSKANLLYWRKYLWHCWDFSAPPAVIRFDAPAVIQRPHRKFAPGELCPPCPPRCAPELASLLCDVSVSSSKQPIWKLDDLHSTFSFSNCYCEQK